MNKKRNPQDEEHNQHKHIRKGNKTDQNKNRVHHPEPNNPHDRDMDDGNGEILGGKI